MGGEPGRKTWQRSSVPADGPQSKFGRNFQFLRRCGIPERRTNLPRRVYESRVPCCRCCRCGCHALRNRAGRAPSSRRASRPLAQPPAAGDPAGATPQKPEDPPKFADTVVVTGSKAEEKLLDTPATMSVITSQTIETAPSANFAELLRSIPGVNITQVSARDINVTSRAATGTLATGQLAMLDGRSALPGFLRVRDVGLSPGELQRGQADRGHPRPRVRRLGRQRPLRRRQRDQQDAERAEGHERDIRVRRVRPAGRRRGVALVRQRHPRRRAERSLVLQALGRRVFTGCAGAADREDSVRHSGRVHGHDQQLSSVREHRARRSRSSMRVSTTTTRTDGRCRSRAESRAPTASCTPASARSTSTAGRS